MTAQSGRTLLVTDDARALFHRAILRRQRVLVALVVAAFATFVVALVASTRPIWSIHLVVDALLLGYLGVLIHFRNAAANREMNSKALGG